MRYNIVAYIELHYTFILFYYNDLTYSNLLTNPKPASAHAAYHTSIQTPTTTPTNPTSY